MKEQFKPWNPRNKTVELLDKIIEVVEAYQARGYCLTLRQLYYQLVARDIIPNKVSEYSKLSTILGDARLAGLVDWEAIEDRTRGPQRPSQWTDVASLMDSALHSFRLPRHSDQPTHIELWTEKDALTSVLKPITNEYHVTLMVNRGYSSLSAMHDAYERFERYRSTGMDVMILYLGDHDPSGLDMDRDIEERLTKMFGTEIYFERIGLTREQIDRFNPPPNPAKVTDPRATGYINEHGKISWEVDAIRPDELDRLVRRHIEDNMDMNRYNARLDKEKEQKKKLRKIIDETEW